MLDELPEMPVPGAAPSAAGPEPCAEGPDRLPREPWVSEGVARLRQACANPVVLVPMESKDLKPAHQRRLRFIFSQGRPIHVTELSVVDLDLIVAGFAYCETLDGQYSTLSAYSRLAITELGLKALKEQLDRRRDTNDVHHTLAGRLARWLREERQCMTWENVTFLGEGGIHAEARLDVASCAMSPRADCADLTAWEVKISVADFRADLANPTKVEASRAIAQSAYYCTPKGLIDPSMLPSEFGLVCESKPGRFEIVKRAKRKKGFVPSPDTLMSLVVRRALLPESER